MNFTDDDEDSPVHGGGVRALRAGDGLITYARPATPLGRRPSRSSPDFLGDLHHLADVMGVDWDEAQ